MPDLVLSLVLLPGVYVGGGILFFLHVYDTKSGRWMFRNPHEVAKSHFSTRVWHIRPDILNRGFRRNCMKNFSPLNPGEFDSYVAENLMKIMATIFKTIVSLLEATPTLLSLAAQGFLRFALTGSPRHRSVVLPPGSRLLRIVSFVYSKKTVDRVFSQLFVDLREEYLEALSIGCIWHARWIHLRGILTFLCTAVAHGGSSMVAVAYKLFAGS